MAVADPPYPVSVLLHYRVHLGWFRPYLEGVTHGKAIAISCNQCGLTTLPPRRTCTCGSRSGSWKVLTGLGTIVAATTGAGILPLGQEVRDLTFALIRMDGADNVTFGRLGGTVDDARVGLRVRLVRSTEPANFPTQAAAFVAADRVPATEITNGN